MRKRERGYPKLFNLVSLDIKKEKMKKIELICVGKIKEDYLKFAIEEYKKRLSKFCNLTITELPEHGDDVFAVKKESEFILAKTQEPSILLDRSGQQISSEELAKEIQNYFTFGAKKLQIIIGGSSGVDNSIIAKATQTISFGRVTYPHQLMRVIALEQIYRAFCITANTPYHK